jgi:hypothetical protein
VRNVTTAKRASVGLDQVAMTAVRQSQFEPATQDRKPVVVATSIE